MDEGPSKGNSPDESGEKIKRVSRAEKTIVGVPVILEPIEVEVPALAIPVEVRNIVVAIRVLPDRCVKNHQCHCPSIRLCVLSGLYLIWDIKVLQ